MRSAARVVNRLGQRTLNTVTTNVPGPPFPLWLAGRRMLEYLPYVPLGQGIRFGVAILSYEGRLAFGVTGDFDAAPDVDVLTKAIDHAMSELLDAARSRSHARRSA